MNSCRIPGKKPSGFRDVGESREGDHIIQANEDPGAIAANAKACRIIDVHFAGCRTVAEIMQIGVPEFQKKLIAAHECSQADKCRLQIDDHDLTHQGCEKSGMLPRCHGSTGLKKSGRVEIRHGTSLATHHGFAKLVLTNSRV